ncbi:MAG: nitrile hydratase subunit beta [Dehalococcoidia bacterium]|nr:nitrile hydratase subunit beta [Dehalococcoidia bacterium]MYA61067.1 nitrile hydratase subunit beta [Dehalococcoidia bacterium]
MGIVLSAEPGEFRPGDDVLVRSDIVDHHHRTPWFIKGQRGRVLGVSGPFFDPETRAHGGTGVPKRLLYQVEFEQTQIWGDSYVEAENDVLIVDVYEQWLRPVTEG